MSLYRHPQYSLGSYNRYAFLLGTGLWYDYPHFGAWPSGYFMTANVFSDTTFQNGAVVAFDRTAMKQGVPAAYQPANIALGGLLPADMDGTNLPPLGSPDS